ncbi:hypothetical protein Tco_0874385 [Tanacetum coccineum]|uniref:DUF4283 domain-containing protein n=1 Tax=Tanacetum coccineum TaxID=301880 RepID=A0ABQ5BN65_9ASTR
MIQRMSRSLYIRCASTTPIYSPGSSSTPIYSPGASRNAECSNGKHLLDKITVLITHWPLKTVYIIFLFHKVVTFDERVTWIDIEGIPLKVWSKNTFSRITSKWGELLDFDEQEDGYLHSKRVCIKTTLVENIYESFKVIIQGKTFWIRAKEVSGWMPDFEEDIDQDSKSDDELSNEGSFDENGGLRITPNVEGESDLEEVAETIFEKEQASVEVKEETDVDAQKNASKVLDMEGDNSGHKVQDVEQESVTKNNSPLNSYKNDTERSTCSGHFKKCDIPRSGGSILQLMEELIKVGQTMGYNMEGCITNIGDIINSQGANDGNR